MPVSLTVRASLLQRSAFTRCSIPAAASLGDRRSKTAVVESAQVPSETPAEELTEVHLGRVYRGRLHSDVRVKQLVKSG